MGKMRQAKKEKRQIQFKKFMDRKREKIKKGLLDGTIKKLLWNYKIISLIINVDNILTLWDSIRVETINNERDNMTIQEQINSLEAKINYCSLAVEIHGVNSTYFTQLGVLVDKLEVLKKAHSVNN